MTNRGAWSNAGVGGTLSVDGKSRGPYYRESTGDLPVVGSGGWTAADPNARAVFGAVIAIQRGINRRSDANLLVDGLYGARTAESVTIWQAGLPKSLGTGVWGGIGPDSAKALLLPLLRNTVTDGRAYIVCGLVQNESAWDPGAVGAVDANDLGLGQINGPSNPTLSEKVRLQPATAFGYMRDRLTAAIDYFDGDLRTAVASYNLGRGGASSWKKAGSPDSWTPVGSSTPRQVNAYVDRILTSCKGI